jgi:hypothetical protein
MKTTNTILIISCLSCMPLFSSAQWITSLSVIPPNPTTTDTIYVIADCSFPSGGCDQKTQNFYSSPPVITGTSLHCLGPLAYICQDSDIYVLPPMPAGNYTFIYQVNAGQGSVPCTPGIVPGPLDSVHIHVTTATGIVQANTATDEIKLIRGTKHNSYIIMLPALSRLPLQLDVISVTGQVLQTIYVTSVKQEFDFSFLNPGIYLIRQGENKNSSAAKFLITD